MFCKPLKLSWLVRLIFPVCYFDRNNEWQPVTSTLKKQQKKPAKAIRCAFCNYIVTSKDKAISINGKHMHVFTNPMGVTFEIALYQQADCVQHGIATTEHTWFTQCAWQVSLCSNCKSHLGWHYLRAHNDSFYGLICDHLVEL